MVYMRAQKKKGDQGQITDRGMNNQKPRKKKWQQETKGKGIDSNVKGQGKAQKPKKARQAKEEA